MFELNDHMYGHIVTWAVRVPAKLTPELQVEAGPPALKAVRRYLDPADEAFAISVTIHPADRFTSSISSGAAAEFVDFIFSRACGCREGGQTNVPGRLGYPLTDPSLFDILETDPAWRVTECGSITCSDAMPSRQALTRRGGARTREQTAADFALIIPGGPARRSFVAFGLFAFLVTVYVASPMRTPVRFALVRSYRYEFY